MHPSFNIMLKLLYEKQRIVVEKKTLLWLEKDILTTLEFSMHYVSAIPFLERF